MNRPNARHAATQCCALSLAATAALAQPTQIPIRALTAPTATAALLRSVEQIRELRSGKVLINSSGERQLLLFDASLSHPTILADTTGSAPNLYPRFVKLIPYGGDSTLLVESDTRSLVVIDPNGSFGRVVAPPRPQDFNGLTSGGPVGVDARGRLVYQGQRPVRFPRSSCTRIGEPPAVPPPELPVDSVAILRGDFETRTVDTIGRAKFPVIGLSFPTVTYDANCRAVTARSLVNPSVPITDAWTITSSGTIAIVRGHDYHIDWISADGTTRSTPKMPYDWRRLTDTDKQKKIDSARKIVDSLTTIGGYRLQSCAGGRSMSFNTAPVDYAARGDGSRGGSSGNAGGAVGGGGGGGRAGAGSGEVGGSPGPANNECQVVAVAADYAPLDSMADYIAPIRENAARADLDGNVWILPSTSAGAKGGLLYDVVNPKGELAERVQLPADRDIAGFGHDGVLYLSHGSRAAGFVIEKVKVIRGS